MVSVGKLGMPFLIGFILVIFAVLGNMVVVWMLATFNPNSGSLPLLYLLLGMFLLALAVGFGFMILGRKAFKTTMAWTGIPTLDSMRAAKRLQSLEIHVRLPMEIVAR